MHAVDLHQGLDVSTASMQNYSDCVVASARCLPQPVSVCGWSMGGLVAMLAAGREPPQSLILIEPSPPGEVQGFDSAPPTSNGTFDPQAVYGAFPAGVAARRESSLARAERKRGVSVPDLPCPSLVIYGDEFRLDRGVELARRYGAQERDFPSLDHWDLVRDHRVREAISAFLGCSPLNLDAAVGPLGRLHQGQNEFYAGGSDAALKQLLAANITRSVPGDDAIAGTYRGLEEVLGYFRLLSSPEGAFAPARALRSTEPVRDSRWKNFFEKRHDAPFLGHAYTEGRTLPSALLGAAKRNRQGQWIPPNAALLS